MSSSAKGLFVVLAIAGGIAPICCAARAQSVSSGSTAGTAGSPLAGPSQGALGSATVADKAAAELDRSGTLNGGRNSGVPGAGGKASDAPQDAK